MDTDILRGVENGIAQVSGASFLHVGIAVGKDLFRITLQGAVAGNHDAFEKIIDLYAPLIEHHCYINGKYDEDLHQYILMRIALKISKFNI